MNKFKSLDITSVERLKKSVEKLKKDTLLQINKLLDELEYPPENLFLGSDIEYIYPYIVTSNFKLDIKTAEKYLENYNSHSFRFFLDTYIEPMKSRFGHLVCPLYTDLTIGIHNLQAFDENCLNDLLEYLIISHGEKFVNYVNNYLGNILEDSFLLRKYGISQNINTIDINKNERIKRDITIFYLKEVGLL